MDLYSFHVAQRVTFSIGDTSIVPASIHRGGGLCIPLLTAGDLVQPVKEVLDEWRRLGITPWVELLHVERPHGSCVCLQMKDQVADRWMPGFDTLDLCTKLAGHEGQAADDLLREIWLALLNTPVAVDYPSADELMAAVRMRASIVVDARRTCVNFHTSEIERPKDCWSYSEETGFILKTGSPLIQSLQKACQPDVGGQLYSFSCSRATEYVILLAIAREASRSNPVLLEQLQKRWQTRAVSAGCFRYCFVDEFGSMDEPLPVHYYVPGDRVWFRNPDAASSEAKGFEGSWVFYLGGGLFTNFWKRDQPFTLLAKCLEIYHWRNGTWRDAAGELQMNETEVERRVAETLADPAATAAIYARMHRLRDPSGSHGEGGCMDATREAPKFVLPENTQMMALLDDWDEWAKTA